MSASPLDSLSVIIDAVRQQLGGAANDDARSDELARRYEALVELITNEARWLAADPSVSAELRARFSDLVRRQNELAKRRSG